VFWAAAVALLAFSKSADALFGLGGGRLNSEQKAKVAQMMETRKKLDAQEVERRKRLRLDEDPWFDDDGHILPWSSRLPDPFAPKLPRNENPNGFQNVPLSE